MRFERSSQQTRSARVTRSIGQWLALAAGMVCSLAAYAQQKPNWGAPGSSIAASPPAAVHPAWGVGGTVGSPATQPGAGQSRSGVGTSGGVVGTTGANGSGRSAGSQPGGPAAALGQSSGPSGTFNAGSSPGVYGAGSRGVTTPSGTQLGKGYNSVTSVPGGGRFAPNQMSSGQLGSSTVQGATSGIGTGSTGGGVADQHNGRGMDVGNGGIGAVSDTPADAPAHPTGQSNVGGDAQGSSLGEGLNKIDNDWGHPANGKDSQGNTWKAGKLWSGYDSDGVKYNNGHPVQGGSVPVYKQGNSLTAGDMDNSNGPGSPNATGQKINKGNSGSGDSGSGWGSTGNSSTGGRNAQGQAINAGNVGNNDAPLRKPGQVGVLNTNKLNNGVTDPAAAGIKH